MHANVPISESLNPVTTSESSWHSQKIIKKHVCMCIHPPEEDPSHIQMQIRSGGAWAAHLPLQLQLHALSIRIICLAGEAHTTCLIFISGSEGEAAGSGCTSLDVERWSLQIGWNGSLCVAQWELYELWPPHLTCWTHTADEWLCGPSQLL